MCGDHTQRESLGGALAVLSPSLPKTGISPAFMAGRLVFHDRGKGSSMATHAMLTTDSSDASHSNISEPCLVRIHETGDLTRHVATSPLWRTFSLKPAVGTLGDGQKWSMEAELGQPMKVEVGSDGIIGRRVSVWTQQGAAPVAEGIIGFN